MSDTDQLDDLWRDTLRDLAETGDGASASARVRRHVQKRLRRRRSLQSLAVACVAIIGAAGAFAATRDSGGPAADAPPTTAPPEAIVGEIRVDPTGAFTLAVTERPDASTFDANVLRIPQPGLYRLVIGPRAGHPLALDGQAVKRGASSIVFLTGRHELASTIPGHADAGERLTIVVGPAADAVDAVVHVSVGDGHDGTTVLRWTSGATTVEENVPVLPGRIEVHWDGVPCGPASRCPPPKAAPKLKFDDAFELDVGQTRRIELGELQSRDVVAHVGNDAIAEGKVVAKAPGVNPPTPAADTITLDGAREGLCTWKAGGSLVESSDPIRVPAATYDMLSTPAASGSYTIAGGSWLHAIPSGGSVKLDLPIGHYTVTCPVGGTLPLIVGE